MSDQRNPIPAFGQPPSIADIEILATRALATFPSRFVAEMGDIGVIVEDQPDDETLRELKIELAWELTGLYRGVPLTERSVLDPVRQPDRIFLYRQPILLEWIESEEDLYYLVRSVVVHEVAHHFGLSDADIAAIEREPE